MDQILAAFSDVVTFQGIFYILLGVTFGVTIGAIPGLNGPMAIAIAVPLTYYMSSVFAIAFLVGILKGSTFGGSISAILLNTPGDPEAAATCLDGYPLAKQGKGEKALKMSLYSSVFGDTFSDLVLIFVSAPLAAVALAMGPMEQVSVIIFALSLIAALSGKSILKGIIMGASGMFVACIGTDPMMGDVRLALGSYELEGGIPIVAMEIGMMALAEVFSHIEESSKGSNREAIKMRKDIPREDRIVTMAEFRGVFRTLIRSSLIGTAIGALPGLGVTIAAFLGYGAAKRASKHPEKFGKGELNGIAAAESANNAVVGSNFIPLFTLGIPGNVTAALIVGAFTMHGVIPGPMMFEEHGRLIYGIYMSMMLANACNLIVGQISLRFFSKIVNIKTEILYPIVIFTCFVGAFLATNSLFSVYVMIAFTVLGYFARRLEFSFVTFIIGFILGPKFELYLQQSIAISTKNPMGFLTRPVTVAFLLLTIVTLVGVGRNRLKNRATSNKNEAPV
ncbi:MAG: Tricarboxylate transporter family protein [bacterium]|nr:Tricarboxylate transporter family protein [bacterium]